jgi:hypothetical protein
MSSSSSIETPKQVANATIIEQVKKADMELRGILHSLHCWDHKWMRRAIQAVRDGADPNYESNEEHFQSLRTIFEVMCWFGVQLTSERSGVTPEGLQEWKDGLMFLVTSRFEFVNEKGETEVRKLNLNALSFHKKPYFIDAIHYNVPCEILKKIIENGVDIDYIDSYFGDNLLDLAVHAVKSPENARYLQSLGLKVSQRRIDYLKDQIKTIKNGYYRQWYVDMLAVFE